MKSSKSKADTVICNGLLVLENGTMEGALAIKDGKIAAITTHECAPEANRVIDARGMAVMPGLVDPHSHIWEPTHYPEREDYLTGSQAAAAGGITTMIEMPLSVPPVTNRDAFTYKEGIVEKKTVVDVAFWGALTEKSTGHYAELNECGCVAYKVFIPYASPDYPHTPDYALLKSMEEISQFNGLVGVHAENADIIHNKQKEFEAKGIFNGAAHEQARPEIAELEAISRVILFAEYTGCRLHICHLSTVKARTLIRQAKERGVDVTVETCPHYLVLDTGDLEKHGGFAKCNPPLRSPENREQLWAMLKAGEFDMIGTDHTPYTDNDRLKHGNNIWKMPPGIGGMDLMLPLMIDEGYHKRGIALEQLAQLMATQPAKRFGLPHKGTLKPGCDADITLVDLNQEWTYSWRNSFAKAKCTHSPFEGRKLKGKVMETLVRGATVYRNGEIRVNPGFGQLNKRHS
ncbi:allantoinase AllB [Endozoicomonas sp. Mp262]|uniref:allantoinase AllB n=1 Tax=Endozoicomonas sp. Mp262 TaxID=2919499 RepID=UPI0021D7E6F4